MPLASSAGAFNSSKFNGFGTATSKLLGTPTHSPITANSGLSRPGPVSPGGLSPSLVQTIHPSNLPKTGFGVAPLGSVASTGVAASPPTPLPARPGQVRPPGVSAPLGGLPQPTSTLPPPGGVLGTSGGLGVAASPLTPGGLKPLSAPSGGLPKPGSALPPPSSFGTGLPNSATAQLLGPGVAASPLPAQPGQSIPLRGGLPKAMPALPSPGVATPPGGLPGASPLPAPLGGLPKAGSSLPAPGVLTPPGGLPKAGSTLPPPGGLGSGLSAATAQLLGPVSAKTPLVNPPGGPNPLPPPGAATTPPGGLQKLGSALPPPGGIGTANLLGTAGGLQKVGSTLPPPGGIATAQLFGTGPVLVPAAPLGTLGQKPSAPLGATNVAPLPAAPLGGLAQSHPSPGLPLSAPSKPAFGGIGMVSPPIASLGGLGQLPAPVANSPAAPLGGVAPLPSATGLAVGASSSPLAPLGGVGLLPPAAPLGVSSQLPPPPGALASTAALLGGIQSPDPSTAQMLGKALPPPGSVLPPPGSVLPPPGSAFPTGSVLPPPSSALALPGSGPLGALPLSSTGPAPLPTHGPSPLPGPALPTSSCMQETATARLLGTGPGVQTSPILSPPTSGNVGAHASPGFRNYLTHGCVTQPTAVPQGSPPQRSPQDAATAKLLSPATSGKILRFPWSSPTLQSVQESTPPAIDSSLAPKIPIQGELAQAQRVPDVGGVPGLQAMPLGQLQASASSSIQLPGFGITGKEDGAIASMMMGPGGSAGIGGANLTFGAGQVQLEPGQDLFPEAGVPPDPAKTQTRDEQAASAVDTWLRFSRECRSVGNVPQFLGSPLAGGKTFLCRLGSLENVDVQITASAQKQGLSLAQVLQRAEKEAAASLSVHYRVSFVRVPGGELLPQPYGHAFIGPKLTNLRFRRQQDRSTLILSATVQNPQVFFFCPSAVGNDWQLHVEVVANVEGKRVWRLAAETQAAADAEKAKQLKAVEEIKQSRKDKKDEKKNAETSVSLRSRNVPLGCAADGTGSKQFVALSWTLVRFDIATDADVARPWSKRTLRPGSLREHFIQPPLSGKKRSETEERSAFEHFLRRPSKTGAAAASIECECQVGLPQTVAGKLLPLDFPAYVGASKLGGLRCELSQGLPAEFFADIGDCANPADCTLHDLSVAFSGEDWWGPLQKSMAGITNDVSWRLQGIYIQVGTHNGLRWLDRCATSVPMGCAADPTGKFWRLPISPQDGLGLFRFDGQLPLEFVCDSNCGVVLELGATFATVGLQGLQAPPGESAVQSQTIGWIVAFPERHATLDANGSLPDGMTSLFFSDLALRCGPGVSFTGQLLWVWKPLAEPDAAGSTVPPPGPRVSFQLTGDRVVRWIRRTAHKRCQPPPLALPLSLAPDILASVPPPPQPTAYSLAVAGTPKAIPLGPPQPMYTLPPPVPPPSLPPTQMSAAQPPGNALATTIHQPAMAKQAPTSATGDLPPEWQAVVERVYLKDMATQSDPPPHYAGEDHVIGEGQAPTTPLPVAMPQGYTGPLQKPLSDADRSQLLAELGNSTAGRLLRGVKPLPTDLAGSQRDLRWRAEQEDLLQADEITFEFISHRSFAGATGERVYFQLRFFAFPPVRTASAALAGGPGDACLLRSSIANERLALVYNVDGSPFQNSGGARETHRQLVEYLATRSAQIEVWNVDSSMQIGLVEMPLEWLVRQGNPVIKKETELVILDPMTSEARGLLKMLMMCRGKQKQLGLSMARDDLAATMKSEKGRRFGNRHKAKALLAPGITVADAILLLGGAGGMSLDDVRGKHQRLLQLRDLRKTEPAMIMDQAMLASVADELRHDRKTKEVARRMEQFRTIKKTLDAPFAIPVFFDVEFENPYSQPATFSVVIAEMGGKAFAECSPALTVPVHGVLLQRPSQAISLVRDPEEWRGLARKKIVQPPPNGDFARLSGTAGPKGVFSLGPRESISIPFRYLAFDHPWLDSDSQVPPGTGVNYSDVVAGGAQADIKKKHFFIEVVLHNGPILKKTDLAVQPLACPVAQTLRFFELEGTPVEKVLALPPAPGESLQNAAGMAYVPPSLIGGHAERNLGRFVLCTDAGVHVTRRDNDELGIRLVAPPSPQIRSFFVIFYADQHFSRATAVQLLEIMGMRSEVVRLSAGQSVDRNLTLPTADVKDATSVSVFSSHPEAVVTQKVHLDPQFGAKANVTITAMQPGKSCCRLHMVDPASSRTIASILLVVTADPPHVKLVHELMLPMGRAVRRALPYKNEAPRPMRYKVRSSNPSIVAVLTPELAMGVLEERGVDLLFHEVPPMLTCCNSVFLHITSEDRAIQETRLLEVRYT